MPRTSRHHRFIIDIANAQREGRRWHAFYQGYRARRANRPGNPHKVGTDAHACWEAGWKFAEEPEVHQPICRFGPGGDYVRDSPKQEGRP